MLRCLAKTPSLLLVEDLVMLKIDLFWWELIVARIHSITSRILCLDLSRSWQYYWKGRTSEWSGSGNI